MAEEKLNLMLADKNLDLRITLKKNILKEKEEFIGAIIEITEYRELLHKLREEKYYPLVLLLGEVSNTPSLDLLLKEISERFPYCIIFLLKKGELSSQQEKEFILTGVRAILQYPIDISNLLALLDKVKSYAFSLKEGMKKEEEGKVFCFFAAKGGVGRTLIATNTAVYISKERKVLLWDMDLQFGDINVLLNLSPTVTIAELSREVSEFGTPLEESLLSSYFINYADTKLYILSAPSKPEEEEKIKIDCIKRIMELSTKLFPYIIIDSTPAFTEYSLYLLDCANLIILVLNLDMPTVKNTRLSLDILERLGYKDKVKLVINRANTSLGLKLSQVRDAFADYEIISETPSEGKIVLPAVNQGIPFVLSHPKRPISMSIKKLADWIISYK